MPSPLVCQRAKPYLITMVTTAPANQRARQAIRDTWGGEVEVRGLRVMTLFMVGVASDPGLAKLLIEEARERGDLIQGRFFGLLLQPHPEDPVHAGLGPPVLPSGSLYGQSG
ncbi:beta-1,3-galactosyltransferase 4 [Lates japonicus]|uniref:Hexosyltransferase n=1 Tax=Lates japonicus TaxID=270547 RepID=A0AAD3M2D8_LATJO|nr:beta-1,3-galactosyltransferase 4 [Lates japonicus]